MRSAHNLTCSLSDPYTIYYQVFIYQNQSFVTNFNVRMNLPIINIKFENIVNAFKDI